MKDYVGGRRFGQEVKMIFGEELFLGEIISSELLSKTAAYMRRSHAKQLLSVTTYGGRHKGRTLQSSYVNGV